MSPSPTRWFLWDQIAYSHKSNSWRTQSELTLSPSVSGLDSQSGITLGTPLVVFLCRVEKTEELEPSEQLVRRVDTFWVLSSLRRGNGALVVGAIQLGIVWPPSSLGSAGHNLQGKNGKGCHTWSCSRSKTRPNATLTHWQIFLPANADPLFFIHGTIPAAINHGTIPAAMRIHWGTARASRMESVTRTSAHKLVYINSWAMCWPSDHPKRPLTGWGWEQANIMQTTSTLISPNANLCQIEIKGLHVIGYANL